MYRFLPLLVFAVLAVALVRGLDLDPSLVDSPLVGQTMPEFSGTSLLDAAEEIKSSDWIGQASLINVWASWCVACLDEHPLLMQLKQSKTFPIYAINYKDTHTDALNWLGTEGNPYTEIVHDLDGAIGVEWGVYGVPESYVINAQGLILYKHIGPLDEEVMQDKILPLLSSVGIL